MSENRSRELLDCVIADPDDDTARLIFADWLEEEGDSDRAEFIRVQIERANLPEWDARQVRLRIRERQLTKEHGPKWFAELPSVEGVSWGEFRRGFMATATCSSFKVLGDSASAWKAAPLQAVTVRWPRRRESIASIEPISGLRELTIDKQLSDAREVGRLANSPLLSTLRALNIRQSSMGVEGFRHLVASPYLGDLEALRVPLNSIGNGGIGVLSDAVSLTALTELDLSESGSYGRYGEDPIIESIGMQELAVWPGLSRIRSLTLTGNDIGRAGLQYLLSSPRTTGLKKLILRNNGLVGQALLEFDFAKAKLQLHVLDLGENLLEDFGAENLARASCLNELKVLMIDRCEIQTSGVHELARAPFLANLRRLNVNDNNFGPDGLQALLEAKPPELHTLEISNNDLGDEGVSHLAESPASDTLLEVRLSRNNLGDYASEVLAKSKHLRNLLVLRLGLDQISKPAAARFLDSPFAKRLAVLEPENLGEDFPEDIPF